MQVWRAHARGGSVEPETMWGVWYPGGVGEIAPPVYGRGSSTRGDVSPPQRDLGYVVML